MDLQNIIAPPFGDYWVTHHLLSIDGHIQTALHVRINTQHTHNLLLVSGVHVIVDMTDPFLSFEI